MKFLFCIMIALASLSAFAGNGITVENLQRSSESYTTQNELPFYDLKEDKCNDNVNTKVFDCAEIRTIPSNKQVVATGNIVAVFYDKGFSSYRRQTLVAEVISLGNDDIKRRRYIKDQELPDFPQEYLPICVP